MERDDFLLACQTVLQGERRAMGIGTLGEKTLHAVLKAALDPDTFHHEQKVGPYVADVYDGRRFIEIQTRALYRLRGKLEYFLTLGPVTVVYPVPALKWMIWLGKDGTATPRRKSPKQAGPWEILPELYGLKPLLGREGLSFCVLLLEVEEYRLKNGWDDSGKRGSTRFDRLPVDLLGQVSFAAPGDFLKLVPDILPEEFTAKEFSKAAKLSPSKAGTALNVLYGVGAVERTGKRGSAYLYRRARFA